MAGIGRVMWIHLGVNVLDALTYLYVNVNIIANTHIYKFIYVYLYTWYKLIYNIVSCFN